MDNSIIEVLESRELLAAPPVALTLGPNVDLHLQAATMDRSGNLLMVGATATRVDIDPRAGVTNEVVASGAWSDFIVKYASNGTPAWVLTIPRPDVPAAFSITSVTSDSAGDFYLTGTLAGSMDFNLGRRNYTLTSTASPDGDARQGADAFVWKIKADGSFGWAALVTLISTGTEVGKAVAFDRFGSVYLAGDSTPETPHTSSPSGSTRSFLARFSASTGALSWAGSTKLGSAGDVAVGPDDCPVLATQGGNLRLVKFNARGRYMSYLSTAASTSANGSLGVASLEFDRAGNAVLAGQFTYTFDFAPGAAQMLLSTNTLVNAPNAFVQKVSAAGSLVFAFQLGNTGSDRIVGASIDSATGDLFVGGHFSGPVDFDPSRARTAILETGDVADGDKKLFAARYTSAGRYVWANAATTAGDTAANAFAYAWPGHTLVVGSLSNSVADTQTIHLYQDLIRM